MKKLIAIALLVVGITTYAQEGKPRPEQGGKEQFTQEQKNQLRLKHLILELDLTVVQQKEMAEIIAEQGSKHEAMKKERQANKAAGKKPTADEKFAMANKALDEKIAMKARIKKILSAEQFAKWEKMKEKKGKKMKAKRGDRKDKKEFSKE